MVHRGERAAPDARARSVHARNPGKDTESIRPLKLVFRLLWPGAFIVVGAAAWARWAPSVALSPQAVWTAFGFAAVLALLFRRSRVLAAAPVPVALWWFAEALGPDAAPTVLAAWCAPLLLGTVVWLKDRGWLHPGGPLQALVPTAVLLAAWGWSTRAPAAALGWVAWNAGDAPLVDALPSGSHTRITDTRKTTPGLRAFERYAVRCGGGINHREDLAAAVLIKDNHLAAAGGLDGGQQVVVGIPGSTTPSRSTATVPGSTTTTGSSSSIP